MEYTQAPDSRPSIVEEPAISYGLTSTTEEKKNYLKKHLHPQTAQYLEAHGFLVDQPFPYDTPNPHWCDEADGDNPAVPYEIVMHDKEVWLHA